MRKLILLGGFVAFISMTYSCSSNKSVYQQTTEVVSSDFESGYFEKNIKGNEYEVTFRGLKMSQQKVFDLSMLRASEIALNKGYKNFVVLSKANEMNKVNQMNIHTNTLKVALYNDVPAKYQTYYNANDEYERLTKKYKIK